MLFVPQSLFSLFLILPHILPNISFVVLNLVIMIVSVKFLWILIRFGITFDSIKVDIFELITTSVHNDLVSFLIFDDHFDVLVADDRELDQFLEYTSHTSSIAVISIGVLLNFLQGKRFPSHFVFEMLFINAKL